MNKNECVKITIQFVDRLGEYRYTLYKKEYNGRINAHGGLEEYYAWREVRGCRNEKLDLAKCWAQHYGLEVPSWSPEGESQ